ncbi:MAG: PSD1 domain-containing protein [Planctomycetales bacterium]|nr:PSD1 domain-containing protein [Planctomycetales bacterium]
MNAYTLALSVSLSMVFTLEASPDDTEIAQAQKLLVEKCWDCHGPEEKNGGLDFSQPQSLMLPADSGGSAVVPNNLDQSQILLRVRQQDPERRMPPEASPLDEYEIAILEKWVSATEYWKQLNKAHEVSALKQTKSSHWSFQPLSSPALPNIVDGNWPTSAVDYFVAAEREKRGLEVVPDAQAATLARRLHYDLTGLPPSPQDIIHFLDAEQRLGRQAASEQLVDRLLASQAYGERWGRHWMDWVRYADTAGDNSDFPIPQAYLYRNYIIESFNCDVPYDRFLTEQIAGDLLPADSQSERNRQRIATGYLAMSRRFGSLVERYPWHLTIEDTLDNLGRTTMGLTLSCARCHDHKFDPITMRDYYGLYGFFASTRYPFPGIELFQVQNDLVPLLPTEEYDLALAPYAEKSQQLTNELEKLLAECRKQSQQNAIAEIDATLDERRQMRDALDAMLIKARRAGERLAEHLKTIPELPMAYAVAEGVVQDASIQIRGEPERPGAVVPRGFPSVLGGQQLASDISQQNSGRLQLAQWIANPQNPLTARVIVNRIWQRHFGRGLVSTTSDFGSRGDAPSHPELLDWLAEEFMNHDWSIKHLHRLLLTSRTYQLASQDTTHGFEQDPENHWLWKFNRSRLDAESLRDSLLFVAGNLDTTAQTKPYDFPPQAEWKFTQHHPFKGDYPSSKRSVYQMTKRLTADTYMQTFDGPDPNVCTSSRDQSVTPLQALYFVNDEFIHQQANAFVRRWMEESCIGDDNQDSARIALATLAVLGRPVEQEETELMRAFLQQVRDQLSPLKEGIVHPDNKLSDHENALPVDLQPWASLVRDLFRLNEFVYID